MTLQDYMLHRQKAALNASSLYLPPIDVRAANVILPASLLQTAFNTSPPFSGSRSSSFSNNSWKSAQDESLFFSAPPSCYSSNASLSSPSICSPWSEYYSPYHPSLNPVKTSFIPPTTTLEELLDRLSYHDAPRPDLTSGRDQGGPSQNAALQQAGQPTPSDPQTTGNAESSSKAPIKTEKYKTELCRSWEEQGQCRYGLKCLYAHGQKELRDVARHPKYKTELCHSFYNTGSCPYAKRCVFVHSTSPLNIETPTEKMAVRKTPLLSRVGVRTAAPKCNKQPASVDVQQSQAEYAVASSITMPLVEKWGLEMASFPSQWLNSSLVDYSTKTANTTGMGTRPLRAGMRTMMV